MSELATLHQSLGAELAADGIPLHYGDLAHEYHSALNAVVLLDRSHEGRISLTERDALGLINRLSTNLTSDLNIHSGCATIFTTATARIIERVEVLHRQSDILIMTHPPRTQMMHDLIKRNIFFNDQVKVSNLTSVTSAFALHGPHSDALVEVLAPRATNLPVYYSQELHVGLHPATLVRRKTLVGGNWLIICATEHATDVYQALLEAGKPLGITPAGSLTYNTLRIRAGLPSLPELNDQYIPLELGLWDEVSFHKGCYTGQEIIARMDSREKLARVMVRLQLDRFTTAPAPLTQSGQTVGDLTSSVTSPTGETFAIGVVKAAYSSTGAALEVNGIKAVVQEMLGTQPEWVINT